jgi:nucleotide-binding universal stress UspA family protein
MVVLNRDDEDQDLIRFAEFCSKIYRPEDIYFVHIAPDLHSQLDFTVRFQDEDALAVPVDEEIASGIRQRIKRYFGDLGQTRIHIDVLEGKVESQVTHWAAVKHADLILMGRMGNGVDETVQIKRLVRHVHASVMILPIGTGSSLEPRLERIMVPVDFSEQSAKALFRAGQLAERLDDVELRIFHAFDIPPGHFQLSRTADQFERIMRANAGEALDIFLKQADAEPLREQALLKPVTGNNAAADIAKAMKETASHLVVIGAHGHGAMERLFVGSVTESLLEKVDRQAILVVKD